MSTKLSIVIIVIVVAATAVTAVVLTSKKEAPVVTPSPKTATTTPPPAPGKPKPGATPEPGKAVAGTYADPKSAVTGDANIINRNGQAALAVRLKGLSDKGTYSLFLGGASQGGPLYMGKLKNSAGGFVFGAIGPITWFSYHNVTIISGDVKTYSSSLKPVAEIPLTGSTK